MLWYISQRFLGVLALVEILGLANREKILLQDYRSLDGKFDHVYAIEMLEAVGHNGIGEFFSKTNKLVQGSGTLNLQVITVPDERYEAYRKNCDFIQKYIFPCGLLPSMSSIKYSTNANSDFVIKTDRSIGKYYPATLINWRNNLFGNLEKARSIGFSDNDVRRFDYYFSYCTCSGIKRFQYFVSIFVSRSFVLCSSIYSFLWFL